MNEKIRLYFYDTSGRLVFVRFLEEFEDTKRHFEINWPLSEFKFVRFLSNLTKFSIFFRPKRPANQFVPRLYGFKIHHLAYQIQQQAAANFKAPMRTMSYNNAKR